MAYIINRRLGSYHLIFVNLFVGDSSLLVINN